MIEYYVHSLAKISDVYESMGGLFELVREGVIKLIISLRIWIFILKILRVIAEFIAVVFNEQITSVIKNLQANRNAALKRCSIDMVKIR